MNNLTNTELKVITGGITRRQTIPGLPIYDKKHNKFPRILN